MVEPGEAHEEGTPPTDPGPRPPTTPLSFNEQIISILTNPPRRAIYTAIILISLGFAFGLYSCNIIRGGSTKKVEVRKVDEEQKSDSKPKEIEYGKILSEINYFSLFEGNIPIVPHPYDKNRDGVPEALFRVDEYGSRPRENKINLRGTLYKVIKDKENAVWTFKDSKLESTVNSGYSGTSPIRGGTIGDN